MRAERKGPLLPPQHISHAGREPRTPTPQPEAGHPSQPTLPLAHPSATGGWRVGSKNSPSRSSSLATLASVSTLESIGAGHRGGRY